MRLGKVRRSIDDKVICDYVLQLPIVYQGFAIAFQLVQRSPCRQAPLRKFS
jgi:hypothetical protein